MEKKYLNFVIAGVLALILTFVVKSYTQQVKKTAVVKKEPEVKILIAVKDIKRGEMIKKESLNFVLVPQKYAQPKVLSAPEAVIGQIAAVDISAGEQMLATKLIGPELGMTLAMQTPAGKRAFTLDSESASAVGGMVRPGDHVDILGVFIVSKSGSGKGAKQPTVVKLLQDVLVLAIGSQTAVEIPVEKDKKASTKSGPITLALTPEDVELLIFAQEQGKIKLILRPPEDRPVEPLPKTSTEIKEQIKSLMIKAPGEEQERPYAPSTATPSGYRPQAGETQQPTAPSGGSGVEIFEGTKRKDEKKKR